MTGYALPVMKGWIGEFQKASINPLGAVGVLSTPARIALGVTTATVAGIAVLGARQMLSQDQQQKQDLSANTKSGSNKFVIYAEKGSTVNFDGVTTGTATAAQTATQSEEQTATQSQPDYMQWLLIGGLAIGAIYFLTKKRG